MAKSGAATAAATACGAAAAQALSPPRALSDAPRGARLSRRQGSDRKLQLVMCSVFEKRGFKEGFDWLSQHIK